MNPTVLSTKILSATQLGMLTDVGYEVTNYDAITISFLAFEGPDYIENAIFSSQNGVQSYFEQKGATTHIENCFCVGEHTALKLEGFGQKVTKKGQNATELAQFITKNHQNDAFYFICGSRRRDEIPKLLKRHEIPVFELKTYQTDLNVQCFDEKWDKILFFSPSGVESYFNGKNECHVSEEKKVTIKNETAICIGATTAKAASKYMSNVIIAPSTTVQSVIEVTVKTIENDKN